MHVCMAMKTCLWYPQQEPYLLEGEWHKNFTTTNDGSRRDTKNKIETIKREREREKERRISKTKYMNTPKNKKKILLVSLACTPFHQMSLFSLLFLDEIFIPSASSSIIVRGVLPYISFRSFVSPLQIKIKLEKNTLPDSKYGFLSLFF